MHRLAMCARAGSVMERQPIALLIRLTKVVRTSALSAALEMVSAKKLKTGSHPSGVRLTIWLGEDVFVALARGLRAAVINVCHLAKNLALKPDLLR